MEAITYKEDSYSIPKNKYIDLPMPLCTRLRGHQHSQPFTNVTFP